MNHVREMFCTTINDEVKACGFHHNRNIYYKSVDGALLGFGIDTKLTHYSVLFGLLSAVRRHTAAACGKLCLL